MGTPEYPRLDEKKKKKTIRSSPQGDITLTVEDEQLVGAKASGYVLVFNKWRGYNTDENGGPEHGYEKISQGYTSTVFKAYAVVTPLNAGTNRSGESFVTKVCGAVCGKEFQ